MGKKRETVTPIGFVYRCRRSYAVGEDLICWKVPVLRRTPTGVWVPRCVASGFHAQITLDAPTAAQAIEEHRSRLRQKIAACRADIERAEAELLIEPPIVEVPING